MIRHIGTWAAVKCDHWQKYNISDLLGMRLKDNNPDGDLYEFYFRWQDVYTLLFGGKEPEEKIMDAVHDAYFRQMSRCSSMKAAIDKYELDVRPKERVYECYLWLVDAVSNILTRERHEYNRTEWDSANHDRNNMPRGVGGPGSLATAGAVLWKPNGGVELRLMVQ